jgi:hypothetical protein
VKPILHFKFDRNNWSSYEVSQYGKRLYEWLGENYQVILTPFDLSNPTKDTTIVNFNGIDYTYEEIIEKLKSE